LIRSAAPHWMYGRRLPGFQLGEEKSKRLEIGLGEKF
jgi:hypothetical protein